MVGIHERSGRSKIYTSQVAYILNDDITKSSNSLTDVSAANAAATEEMNANIEELNAMMHGVSEMAGHMNEESDGLKEALSFFHN